MKQKLEKLTDTAIDTMQTFLDNKKPTTTDFQRARLANGVITSYSRLRSSETAREAATFAMARELSANRDQLEQTVRKALPDSALVKALPERAALESGGQG